MENIVNQTYSEAVKGLDDNYYNMEDENILDFLEDYLNKQSK